MDIELLRPSERLRVMDLVASLGLDVSDWANFKGGVGKAASNPKYCYEWSYEDNSKNLIILNLWYDSLESLDGFIVQNLNLRETARKSASSPQARRAIKMDFSLQKAARLGCPVRVIICDGSRRDAGATKSSADRRFLDGEPWYVKSYNSETGDCILVRGNAVVPYVDQFELEAFAEGGATRKEVMAKVYDRSSQVRGYVLKRANGCCEWCGCKGFKTYSGAIYLETHHIQPLSEGGSDAVENVIALCPNHHREAHFGENAEQVRRSLFERVKELADDKAKNQL